MESRLKLVDVASVLSDMRKEGVIGKYAVGGASAVAFYTEPIATKAVLDRFDLIGVWRKIEGGLPDGLKF